jgi:tartrate dehydrogenase/decarboxylase/D-malate dehydrogenase
VFTRRGIERVVRYSFELARSRPAKHLISVTKSNAQRHTLLLWDEIFARMAADYPDIRCERVLVDAMAARMILQPDRLDVIVASHLFADILTDLTGAIGGSLGLAASANLNPERAYPSMFEPVHGSAFDIIGAGIANPIGTLWSAALMLEHLGAAASAATLMTAIERTTSNRRIMTPDVGGQGTTQQVIDHVCALLRAS